MATSEVDVCAVASRAWLRAVSCCVVSGVKSLHAQQHGAAGTIIWNHQVGTTAITAQGSDLISIPALFIGYQDGSALTRALSAGENVSISIPATGATDPAEKAALQELFGPTRLLASEMTRTGAGARPLYNNMSTVHDPCLES